jgi:hypothetical protein
MRYLSIKTEIFMKINIIKVTKDRILISIALKTKKGQIMIGMTLIMVIKTIQINYMTIGGVSLKIILLLIPQE